MSMLLLQRIHWSAITRPFAETEFMRRIPSVWIPPEDFERVLARMQHPEQYCIGSLIGDFPGYGARFLPCLEMVDASQQYCMMHRPAPIPPRVYPPPAPPPAPRSISRPPQPALSPVAPARVEEHPVRPSAPPPPSPPREWPRFLAQEPNIDASVRVNRRGDWIIGGRVLPHDPLEDVVTAPEYFTTEDQA